MLELDIFSENNDKGNLWGNFSLTKFLIKSFLIFDNFQPGVSYKDVSY